MPRWAGPGGDVTTVLKDQQEAFDPTLAADLVHVEAIQAKTGEEQLDADPFIEAQDLVCEHQQQQLQTSQMRFEVGKIDEQPMSARVEVYLACAGKTEPTPQVIATLSRRDGKWVFADFGTPDDPHQLTTTLRTLLAEASSPASSESREQAAQLQTAEQEAAAAAEEVERQERTEQQQAQRQARQQAQQQSGIDDAARQMLADGQACFNRQDYTCAITNAGNALRIKPGYDAAEQLRSRAQAAQSRAMDNVDIH